MTSYEIYTIGKKGMVQWCLLLKNKQHHTIGSRKYTLGIVAREVRELIDSGREYDVSEYSNGKLWHVPIHEYIDEVEND